MVVHACGLAQPCSDLGQPETAGIADCRADTSADLGTGSVMVSISPQVGESCLQMMLYRRNAG